MPGVPWTCSKSPRHCQINETSERYHKLTIPAAKLGVSFTCLQRVKTVCCCEPGLAVRACVSPSSRLDWKVFRCIKTYSFVELATNLAIVRSADKMQQSLEHDMHRQLQKLVNAVQLLASSTDTHAAMAALSDIAELEEALKPRQASQVVSELSHLHMQLVTPLLLVLAGQNAARQASVAEVTACWVLSLLCKTAGAQSLLTQPQCLERLVAYYARCTAAAASTLQPVMLVVLSRAADMQQLALQHLQTILQLALAHQPGALCFPSASETPVTSKDLPDRRCSASNLLSHLAAKPQAELLLSQQLPRLLQQMVVDPAGATNSASWRLLAQLTDDAGGAGYMQDAVQHHFQQVLTASQKLAQQLLDHQHTNQNNGIIQDQVFTTLDAATVVLRQTGSSSSVRQGQPALLVEKHLVQVADCLLPFIQYFVHATPGFGNYTTPILKQAVQRLVRIATHARGATVLADRRRMQQLIAAAQEQTALSEQQLRAGCSNVLQIVQQLMHTAAAAEEMLPLTYMKHLMTWLQAQVQIAHEQVQYFITLQQESGSAKLLQQLFSMASMSNITAAAGLWLEWDNQLLLDELQHFRSLSVEDVALSYMPHGRKAVQTVVQLLDCLMPLAGCRKGLVALAPHALLLQEAAATVRCDAERLCKLVQELAAAALAEWRVVQQQYKKACDDLRECILSMAVAYAEYTAELVQGNFQQRAEVALVEVSRLAAASSKVQQLELMLQHAKTDTAVVAA